MPTAAPHNLALEHPGALYLIAAAAIVALWGIAGAGWRLRAIAPLMRALAIALFALAMAGPNRVAQWAGAARPAVVDMSASITAAMRAWTAALLNDGLRLRSTDPAILFAGKPVSETIGAAQPALAAGAGCPQCGPGATDLEAALSKLAGDPAARGGTAALITDGWENRGNARRAIGALLAARIPLDIFTPPGARSIPNVAMTALTLPPAMEKAAPFALGVTMENFNAAPAAGTIAVYRGGAEIAARRVTLAPGAQRIDFNIGAEAAGLASYRAEFKPGDPAQDVHSEDDSLQAWVGVGARRKVLILTDSAKDAAYLQTVVERMGLAPTVVPVAAGAWNGSIEGYDAVLINNLPSERIAPAAQAAIAAYAKRGGAIAMIGGDASFGLGGYENSPIAAAMPVTMKPPEHRERQRALVLIIDKSSSMGFDNKLTYAKAAAETVTATLKDADRVGVIGFDSQPFVVVPLAPFKESRPYFDQMVNRLVAHGTTFLMPALREAERSLAQSGAPIKHVVILTDGETGGTADMYYDLVSRMHHDLGATISTIAVGRRANVALLQAISRYGGGAYYQTDSASNLPKLFIDDFRSHGGETTMAESVFTPHTVVPDPILKDLAGRKIPPIKGYVSTSIKPRADLDMFIDRKSGAREPVIASWKYGAGRAMAVTTDASGRWSGAWVTGGVFQPLWDRLLAWLTPQTAAEPEIAAALGYSHGRIEIQLTDYSAAAETAPETATVTVTHPGGAKSETRLTESAPGELSGSIDARAPGDYYFEVRSPSRPDRKFPPLAYTVSPAIDAELPRPEPNYGLLQELAAATGGRLNPPVPESGLAHPSIERREPLAPYLIIVAMLTLIGEALVRRLTA